MLMNKILRYSFVALLAMFGLNTYAGDVTIAANSSTFLASGDDYVATQDGVTITYSKGTSSTAISGGIKDDQIRVYKNAILTISSSQTISKIVVTAVINNQIGADGFVAEGYAAADDKLTGTWTGSSNSVTLTASVGQVRITQVVVTVGGAPSVTVAAPTIEGLTSFAGSTEVTIVNNEESASVYYTTDGNDPTASSTPYLTPFVITETTTVKAIAIKGETSSSIVSKTFTAVPSVANIAALNALENGNTFAFAGEPLVVFVSGRYAYIKDETGSSLIFDNGTTKLANLAVGKKVAANWTGKVSIYNNLFEAVPDATLDVVAGDPVVVNYPEVAMSDVIAANMNQVVVIKDVTYTAPEEGSKNFTITKGEETVNGYNQFGLEIAASVEGKTYDITGVISVYKENVQFQPIAIAEAAVEPEPEIHGTKIAEMDYTTATSYPYYRQEPTDPTAGNFDVQDGALVITATAPQANQWEMQPFILDQFNLQEGCNYDIAIEMEATSDVDPLWFNMGTWGGNAALYGQKATAKRGIKVFTYENLPAAAATSSNNAHLLFQCGSFVGTIKIYNVGLYEYGTPSGINTINADKAENGVRYNLAGQKVNNGFKGVVIMNGKKMLQ